MGNVCFSFIAAKGYIRGSGAFGGLDFLGTGASSA